MTFSRPILIEHKLTISEEQLRAQSFNNHYTDFSTSVKDVQKFAKISFELIINCGESSDRIALSLNCNPGSDANGRLRGTFSFYNISANFVIHSSRDFDEENNYNYSYDEIGTVADLLNPEKGFIEDGKLTIHMKGMLFVEPLTMCTCDHDDNLSKYLWRCHDDHDFTISVGKENEPKTEFKIHKLVLTSRSPVFNRMLKTDMKESAENKLEIVDFDPEVVNAAIYYMYDVFLYKCLGFNTLLSLLQFAEKYDIQGLKDKLVQVLYKKLSPANICEIANASILSNSPKLKDLCFRFMIIYIKQGIPFDRAETLDKDLASELLKKASMPLDDLLL